MKILTWNINGIRASKVKLEDLFDKLGADIICLQETKVTRDLLDEPSAIVEGFNSYFSFSRSKSGYSGVATFVKNSFTPVKAEEGLTGLLAQDDDTAVGCYGDMTSFTHEELVSLDNEGRTIITQHKIHDSDHTEKHLTVINVYCPRADPENSERKLFKLKFYNVLQARAEAILASGSHVIVLGDINMSHKPIDHCDPSELEEFIRNPGRVWLDNFLLTADENGYNSDIQSNPTVPLDDSLSWSEKHCFVDSFRHFHPHKTHAFTCWSTVTGARATNYGTRIDYILGDVDLVRENFMDCFLMPEVEGSDHCPVKACLNCQGSSASKCPPLCSKYLPQFTAKQQKLSSFFKARDSGLISADTGAKLTSVNQKVPSSEKLKDSTAVQSVKRSSSDTLVSGVSKKHKPNSKSQKQSTLMGFFNRKPQNSQHKTPENLGQTSKTHHQQISQSNRISAIVDDETVSLVTESQKQTSSAWKNLLKGPPPPPLCKGHNEACVLRTVKKDGLNKGRQFWVCNRPEGHKTNPEARCDYFVWIDKKKHIS